MTADSNVIEYLPLFLLPQRINAIRSFVFIWHFPGIPPLELLRWSTATTEEANTPDRSARWKLVWHSISTMGNLRSLYVKLHLCRFFGGSLSTESAMELLDPIKKITWSEVFILSLPVPIMDMDSTEPRFEYPLGGGQRLAWRRPVGSPSLHSSKDSVPK